MASGACAPAIRARAQELLEQPGAQHGHAGDVQAQVLKAPLGESAVDEFLDKGQPCGLAAQLSVA